MNFIEIIKISLLSRSKITNDGDGYIFWYRVGADDDVDYDFENINAIQYLFIKLLLGLNFKKLWIAQS